jgi:hypothetical protein
MLLIQGWTDDINQTMGVTLEDGSIVTLTLYYSAQQLGWFIKSLTWNSFTLYGIRITNNINILLSWRNLIPFGLACLTAAGYEPSQPQDLSSAASKLYILDSADIEQLDQLFAGATS